MNHKVTIAGVVIIAIVGITYYVVHVREQQQLEERQAYIHNRGAEVMPFDLGETQHTFTETKTGGIQQVRVTDPNNTPQIDLVRMHIHMEADAFSAGNFGDPATLHGADMPGLSVLQQSAGMFTVTYTDLPDGAQLTYTSDDPEVQDALHMWFQAQRSDHGDDATAGME